MEINAALAAPDDFTSGTIFFHLAQMGFDATKPQPIPRGDYTYAKALANHRIEQLMKQLHILGASVALVADQQIVWTDSFGLADIDRQKPITEATIFKM